jgi:hypothetical protein
MSPNGTNAVCVTVRGPGLLPLLRDAFLSGDAGGAGTGTSRPKFLLAMMLRAQQYSSNVATSTNDAINRMHPSPAVVAVEAMARQVAS